MLAAMPAAVSENTREKLFGAAHANRRCSERRAVRRLLPSSWNGRQEAWLKPCRRKAGTAGGKRLRNRQAIREKAFGPDPPPDGTGTPEAKPDDERRLSRASRNVRDSVQSQTSVRQSRPDATSITMLDHSRCDGTRGDRQRITAAELSTTTPERRSPNSAGATEGVAWGWWQHRPHLLLLLTLQTGSPVRHGSTSETDRRDVIRPGDNRLRSAWRHPWPSWQGCS